MASPWQANLLSPVNIYNFYEKIERVYEAEVSLLSKFPRRESINWTGQTSLSVFLYTTTHTSSPYNFAAYLLTIQLHSIPSQNILLFTHIASTSTKKTSQQHTAASKMAYPVSFANQIVQGGNFGHPNQHQTVPPQDMNNEAWISHPTNSVQEREPGCDETVSLTLQISVWDS